MNTKLKWFDRGQPQTLQIAVIILYIQAAFLVLQLAFANAIGLALLVAFGGGAVGIANEKRYGYFVAIGGVGLTVLYTLSLGGAVFSNVNLLISLVFDVGLLAALVHPESRSYQKIWFR